MEAKGGASAIPKSLILSTPAGNGLLQNEGGLSDGCQMPVQ